MKYLYIISSDINTVITNHVLRNHHWNAGADEIMIKEMRVIFLEVRGRRNSNKKPTCSDPEQQAEDFARSGFFILFSFAEGKRGTCGVLATKGLQLLFTNIYYDHYYLTGYKYHAIAFKSVP